jgi:hypothetical protein
VKGNLKDLMQMEHGCTKVGHNGHPAVEPQGGKSKKLQMNQSNL